MSRSQSAHGNQGGRSHPPMSAAPPSTRPFATDDFCLCVLPPRIPWGGGTVHSRPMRGLVGYRRLWQGRALLDGVQGALFDAPVSHQPDVRPRLGSVVGDAVFFIGGLGYIGELCLRLRQPMAKQWLPVMAWLVGASPRLRRLYMPAIMAQPSRISANPTAHALMTLRFPKSERLVDMESSPNGFRGKLRGLWRGLAHTGNTPIRG